MLRVIGCAEAGVEGRTGVTHASLGGDDHAVAGQVEPAPQVKSVAEGPERGVKSSDGLVGLGADEQAGGADAENVTRAVVLPLIDVVVADALETTGTRRCKNS